ncbi:hypothetical protein A3K89_21170 [Rhodococcoides kyotonense]|uniref:Uncharacterized protein n=1 Tax=Rhodococcoides kyotonense TaxID=398843 RepID=A0A177YFE0_9NOCA|nr:hypothetical protein A3K89_21170 [Rhodococcus kyotonensis]
MKPCRVCRVFARSACTAASGRAFVRPVGALAPAMITTSGSVLTQRTARPDSAHDAAAEPKTVTAKHRQLPSAAELLSA